MSDEEKRTCRVCSYPLKKMEGFDNSYGCHNCGSVHIDIEFDLSKMEDWEEE
jgi:hypothetical protein